MSSKFQVSIETAGGYWTAGWPDDLKEAQDLALQYKDKRTRIYDNVKGRYFDSNDNFWRSNKNGKPMRGEKTNAIVNIIPMQFTNLKTSDVTLGYHIYNNSDSVLWNKWTEIPSEDTDILKKILEDLSTEETPDQLMDIFVYILDYFASIKIGDNLYTFNQIESILADGLSA